MNMHNQTAVDDVLYLASRSINTRTLFISNIDETFKILKVFNQNGCDIAAGLELPKDHSI